MFHCLSQWYIDFQSIMGRTCQTDSTSIWHSPTTLTISEHGKMLICDDQHQVFWVCNWLYRHSCHPEKLQILKDCPIPQNIHELRIFLGLANFYQRFILGVSHIAWPLNQLMKGNGKIVFEWTPTQQQAFEQIKTSFVLHRCLCYLICISLLRLRQMHQTMPSA